MFCFSVGPKVLILPQRDAAAGSCAEAIMLFTAVWRPEHKPARLWLALQRFLPEPPNLGVALWGQALEEIFLDGATHIYDDAHRLVIGEENTHSAAVLHGFVVMEGQFVHCVVGWPVDGLRALGAQQLLRLPALQSQLPTSSYNQQKHRGAPQRRFHHCRKSTGRPVNKGEREPVKRREASGTQLFTQAQGDRAFQAETAILGAETNSVY